MGFFFFKFLFFFFNSIRTLRRERVSAIVQAELRNIQRVAELRQKPACLQVSYNKDNTSPYTKTRVILMNGTEFESQWFMHQCRQARPRRFPYPSLKGLRICKGGQSPLKAQNLRL